MNPGDVFAYAGPTLTNRTDQPAVIDEVVAMGLPASVRVVRETTLFPPSFSNGPYPFTGVNARFRDAAFEPLVGSIVPAGTSQSPGLREIVFFVTPTEPGVYLTQGLWISYHVGAEHYRYFEPSQWGLCALPATCPAWT
jgi:hypothetical protein